MKQNQSTRKAPVARKRPSVDALVDRVLQKALTYSNLTELAELEFEAVEQHCLAIRDAASAKAGQLTSKHANALEHRLRDALGSDELRGVFVSYQMTQAEVKFAGEDAAYAIGLAVGRCVAAGGAR
ncbi:MAG: hypothetical protein NT151_09885 [Acidobacteria bacterium]|nr:hypothetical protein [Acidobacteriota bacterium]